MKNETTETNVLPPVGDFVRAIEALEDSLETMSPRNAESALNEIDNLSNLCREFRRMHSLKCQSRMNKAKDKNRNWITAMYVQRAIRQLDNLNGFEMDFVPDNVIEFLEKHRS